MEPALVVGPNDLSVVREEVFGPLVTMIRLDDPDGAIAITNSSDYGLNNYVFSGDTGRAPRIAQRLEAGSVAVDTALQSHEAPFGGFKGSGIGRDFGEHTLLAYTEIQGIIWTS